MLRLQEVLSEWKDKDSKIDKIEIDKSALEIACLHAKYLEYNSKGKKQLRDLRAYKVSARLDRKSSEYVELTERISETEDLVAATESILGAISQMSYTLSTICRWRCFVNGASDL